jgi:hypothetical protein
VQGLDRRASQLDNVTTVMQCRQVQLVTPELRLGFHQMQLRIVFSQDVTNAVDMIMMTVGQQDVGNPHPPGIGQRQHLGNIPGRVHNRCASGGVIMDQVNEVFHWPQFQGMDRERFA